MPPESNQPGDLPSIPVQFAGTSSSSSPHFRAQKPASIMYGYEQFSSTRQDISPSSQLLHSCFDFEHQTMSDVTMGNVEAQYSGLGLGPIQQLNLQMPLVENCFDGNSQQSGNYEDYSNGFLAPNTRRFDTSDYISQHFINDHNRLETLGVRKCFDTSHQESQNFMYHSNNAQTQNPQPYFNAKDQRAQDFTCHPNSARISDIESQFEMSHRTNTNFFHRPSSAQVLNSGHHFESSHQKPSNFPQQFNHPSFQARPAMANPLNQYHESRPLMDNPHFQQCRSYDLRMQEDMVYSPHGGGLHAANALQNALTQEERGSRAAEQAYLARMERQRIGDCPPVGSRREKRRWSELCAGQHFQQDGMSEGRISMEREGINSASKSPTSIEKIVFTTPNTPENYTHQVHKDDMVETNLPAKKRKTLGSHEINPSRQGLTVTSPILIQDDALSTPKLPLTPLTSSNIRVESPSTSLEYLSLSQIATISIPAPKHSQSCEISNIDQQLGYPAPRSSPLIDCSYQNANKTLPSLMLGPDRNIPWPERVPWPVGRRPVSDWSSALPKPSRARIPDQGGYPTPDFGKDTSSVLPSVPITLENGRDGKMLPDGVLSDKALSSNDDAVLSLLDLSNATEACALMPPTKHQYVFSFRHHLIVEKQFEMPFRPYIHPDIGKITFTKPAVITQDLEILDSNSSEDF